MNHVALLKVPHSVNHLLYYFASHRLRKELRSLQVLIQVALWNVLQNTEDLLVIVEIAEQLGDVRMGA